jgi:hypothetical protein
VYRHGLDFARNSTGTDSPALRNVDPPLVVEADEDVDRVRVAQDGGWPIAGRQVMIAGLAGWSLLIFMPQRV